MIYESDALTVKPLEGDIAELNFDLQGESVNKFDQATVTSLTAFDSPGQIRLRCPRHIESTGSLDQEEAI